MHSTRRTDMPPTATDNWTELAHRAGDGLSVTLLWSPSTNLVQVALVDERVGRRLELDVDPAEALTAFDHPFAYATAHGRRFPDLRPLSLSGTD
jgi:hypothetical protein